jgi:type III pantothenate kinase
MILIIDSGNSRIKWGLWEDRGFVAQGAVLTARSGDFANAVYALPRVARAIGSNVAGMVVEAQIEQALDPWGVKPQWIRSQARQCGVVNGYVDPAQLGTDRWAALIGAHTKFAEACIVVNVGTAVTVDALTADGRFLGGLILPGIELMGGALSAGTARLPRELGSFEVFPTTTANAIYSGALQGICGAIERMERALTSAGQVRIVVSGGAAEVIAAQLGRHVTIAADLVLNGLVAIAQT